MSVMREAGTRTRVVIRYGLAPSGAAAMRAAVHLARAFDTGVEGVFVEDRRQAAASALSCTRLVSPLGRRSWTAQERDMAAETRALAAALGRRFAQMAAEARIAFHAAAESAEQEAPGAPRFIVVGDPREAGEPLGALLTGRPGAAGLIIAGPGSADTSGPVAAIIEDKTAAAQVLPMARRLASALDTSVVAVPFCGDWAAVQTIEQGLLDAGNSLDTSFYRDCLDNPLELVLALRRFHPGFAVAQFGGAFLPSETELLKAAEMIGLPLLLLAPKSVG